MNHGTTTAPGYAWIAAGRPTHPYPVNNPAETMECATCATRSCIGGARVADVETSTMAGHAEIFRTRGDAICPACAWLFAAGKGRPGNFIVAGDRLESTVISVESVVENKKPWLAVLPEIAVMPPETPVCGVMTTDVKPRLWPRMRLATVARFGMYIHCADYDVSEYRIFDLHEMLCIVDRMLPMLRAGYAKASLYHGLLRDYARASRSIEQAMQWENHLSTLRTSSAFLPALIVSGVTKESKTHVKPIDRTTGPNETGTTPCDRTDPPQLGLF